MREAPHGGKSMKPWLASALAICASTAAVFPLCARAQTLPAAVQACAREKDPGQRLDCYDREIPRYLPKPQRTSPVPKAASSSSTAPAVSPTPPSAAAPAAAPAATTQSITRQPAASEHKSVAASLESALKSAAGGSSDRFTAHIVSLQRGPGVLVMRLDNGQVWQQTGRASGDLTLRVGNKVTIEKRLGNYYLSSRYVYGMRVRRESR
jgi:hypothetical protein